MSRIRFIQNFGGAAAEYVSLLGTVNDKDASLRATTMTFTGVTLTTDESVFVGIGMNTNPGALPITVTDNLGNTYVSQKEMQGTLGFGAFMASALYAAIPSVAGTINQIDMAFPVDTITAAVAARFRNIGSPISSTAETAEGADYSAPNSVLTQAGPSDGIGISCFADRSTGSASFSPGILIGTDTTTGGANASNIIVALGYASPVTSSGLFASLLADNTRPFVHVGKQYNAA